MATMDTRYGFTAQYLRAARFFAREALAIEDSEPRPEEGDPTMRHRGYVVAAIMQSTAALEAEAAEIMMHGPGNHLGSNGIDVDSRDFLRPLVELIDRERVVERYTLILHLLHKPPIDRGTEPAQSAVLLVKLRNELVHYKSEWGEAMARKNLFRSLQELRHPKPPFIRGNGNFFPHECLSAACADWAWRSAMAFLDAFFHRLGSGNPLDGYRDRMA